MLADYILSLLAKEPGQRPTADQITAWLAASAGQNDKQQSAMRAGTVPTPTAVLPDAAPPRLYGRGAAQRRTRVLIGVAGLVVFGTAAAVGAAWSADDARSRSDGAADQAANRKRLGSRGDRPPAFGREAYKQRNTVERASTNSSRGLATRYDKTATIYLAAIFIWSAT